MELSGTAAIVTGGASGLGGATADMLAKGGARVTIFDLNADLGTEKAKAIGGHFVKVDVTDEPAVQAAIEEAEGLHGKARICVNCAGIGPPAKVVDRNGNPLPLADFAKIISINLLGTFNVLSKFAARIVNEAPLTPDGEVGQPAYAASKGGIVAMTLPIARELARSGIRVMTIAPGIFWTPLLASLPQEAQDSLGQQVPFPSRLGHPEEYAMLAQSIIANPMLNGETIRLDGSIRMAAK